MKKYRIYIDEVGNPDLKSSNNDEHRYLSLTGVIFDLDYVNNFLFNELEELKKIFFNSHPDEPIILHRKELVHKKYPFHILRNIEKARDFDEYLLRKLSEWKFIVISVLIDKMEHNKKYSTWKYDPYHYCLEVLIERFRLFLMIENAVGDVMIESRGGREDIRLKKSFQKLWNTGTHFLSPEDLQKKLTSKELKVKPKSANISGLQIANLLAHPSRRYIFQELLRIKEDKNTFGDNIIEILKHKYFRYNGSIIGYGIKKLP